ncbi:cellulase domain-containing protein, partial [Haematococcus lacustris]
GWRRMNFEEYFAWFSIYVDLHIQGSAAMGKPILLQEFNILSWKFSDQQRAALFQLAFDKLAASRSSGGALAGVMFWSAALQGVPDDGYNVYIDQQLAGANFITRSGTKLKDGGQDFYFVGTNAYWLVDAASYSGRNYRIPIFFEKAKGCT